MTSTEKDDTVFSHTIPAAAASFVAAAAAPSEDHPVLAAVALRAGDAGELVVEATDTFRVHRATFTTPAPPAPVAFAADGLEPGAVTVAVTSSELHVNGSAADLVADYPQLDSVVAAGVPAQVAVSELTAVVAAVGNPRKDRKERVRFTGAAGNVAVSYLAGNQTMTARATTAYRADADGIDVSVDAHLFADAVRALADAGVRTATVHLDGGSLTVAGTAASATLTAIIAPVNTRA